MTKAALNVVIPRQLREVRETAQNEATPPDDEKIVAITALRDTPGWVLLGEPGAGKTTLFENEAAACGGRHISIRDFIHDNVDEALQGKTLFLDGLDEVRADAAEGSVLTRVATRLKRYGISQFRIACRAADWTGESDINALSRASANTAIQTFQLCPLTDKDVHDILEKNFGLQDPQNFMDKARDYRIQELLYNPQTLGLMVSVVAQGGAWPTSRLEVFDKACKVQVGEANKAYRDAARLSNNALSEEQLLDAAGYLFSAMLLGNTEGFSLDQGAATTSFPSLEAYAPPDPVAASAVVKRRLFISAGIVEKLIPSHRSIAEFLAAKWLAKQVAAHHLPIGRLCNLLVGFDQKPVSDLRGLYAWLATQSTTLSERFLNADPLTVILYGDVKPMSVVLKRQLLFALETLAYTQSTVLRHALYDTRKTSVFSALFDPDLVPDFLSILTSPKRDAAQQAYVQCVLAILENNTLDEAMIPALKRVIEDGRYDEVCRHDALEAWMSHVSDSEAIALLDAVNEGRIDDTHDEISGRLLCHLFPKYLSADRLITYLHVPKKKYHVGMYIVFWKYQLPERIEDTQLKIVLEQICKRDDLSFGSHGEYYSALSDIVANLVTKGVEVHGDSVSDACLFSWLMLGIGKYHKVRRKQELQSKLSVWLSARPERYKELLAICYERYQANERYFVFINECQSVLLGAVPPADIGLWHFQRIEKETNEFLAREYLSSAISTISKNEGNTGLTMEMIHAWAANNPIHQKWVHACLEPDWRKNDALREQKYESEQSQNREERSVGILNALPEIKSGTAAIGILSELAQMWEGHYSDFPGESSLDRYEKAYKDFEIIYDAAQIGFRACVSRDDIPSLQDILDIYIKGQKYKIGLPLLIGAQLRWEEDPTFIYQLSKETLASLFCFYLIIAPNITANWVSAIVSRQTNLIADVMVMYVSRCFAGKRHPGYALSLLLRGDRYGDVARIAIPQLLQKFPLKSTAAQLDDLANLLKSGLDYPEIDMSRLISERITRKSLDMPQRVYWLMAGLVLAPDVYEEKLWDYVGDSWKKVQLISDFLGCGMGISSRVADRLPPYTLGRLIEISAPHALFGWGNTGEVVTVNDAMHLADQIHALVAILSGCVGEESHRELTRLLSLPDMLPIKQHLENARHTLQQRLREDAFRFLSLDQVTNILQNKAPANASDLFSLTLAHLEDIAVEIGESNSDLYRQFWTEDKQNNKHKEENSCRDVILSMLKDRFASVGVQCDPEVDAVGDKRTDIRLSYKTELALPIEIKGEWNKALWSGGQNQLINQYVNSKSDGYGIYLVLWFGVKYQLSPKDGGKKPTSPKDLETRLQATVPIAHQDQIKVVVMDVSWPTAKTVDPKPPPQQIP
jgi:hypothetical protein